jgi:hypothetical protein
VPFVGLVVFGQRGGSRVEVSPELFMRGITRTRISFDQKCQNLHIADPHDPVTAPGRGLRMIGFSLPVFVISSADLTTPGHAIRLGSGRSMLSPGSSVLGIALRRWSWTIWMIVSRRGWRVLLLLIRGVIVIG